MKKGHPNPERLDQTIEIIEAPSKVFILASALTVAALAVWSVVAEIPATVPAKAVFIQPYSASTLKATGDGRFFFRSDLSNRTAADIASFITVVNQELANIMQDPYKITPQQTIDRVTNGINTFFKIATAASLEANNLQKEINTVCTSCRTLKSGEVFGYILNDQVALNFASNLALFSQQDIYTNQAVKANRGLLSQGNLVDQALVKRVKTLQELERQGIVPQSTVLQAKQQLLQQNQTNISQLLSLESSKSNKNQQLSKLIGNIAASTRSIQLKSNEDITILSKLVRSGSKVTTNQGLAIVSTSDARPYLISCFIPGVSFSGVQIGDKVLVSPVNVDQNTYGSISGRVENISSVSLGPDDAQVIIGDPSAIKSLFSSEQSLFFATIRLDKASTASGYKWTSSNGPDFQIPKTTIANVQLITKSYKPYQIVLPFLKSLTGT